MSNSKIAKEIMKVGSRTRVLTAEEKRKIVTFIETLASEVGLGEAMTVLWEQQKAIEFILGTPVAGENTCNVSVFLSKRIGQYWLIHSAARKDRRNIPTLKQHRIIAEQPRFVYEGYERGVYVHDPLKRPGFERECPLCSAASAFPNEVLLPVELGGAGFLYGANFATLGHSHFTLWTEVPMLQVYRPMDSLTWLCAHGDRLQCEEYCTFFNGLGAGNSLRHFHYQTLRESLPIFEARPMHKLGSSGIQRLDWPMPAYLLIVPKGNERLAAIRRLDAFIATWLDMALPNTLNLAHRKDGTSKTHLIFVPRIDADGKRGPSEVSNDFAGCEVCGRINIESQEEWTRAATNRSSDIDAMLRAIAPPAKAIEQLESLYIARVG